MKLFTDILQKIVGKKNIRRDITAYGHLSSVFLTENIDFFVFLYNQFSPSNKYDYFSGKSVYKAIFQDLHILERIIKDRISRKGTTQPNMLWISPPSLLVTSIQNIGPSSPAIFWQLQVVSHKGSTLSTVYLNGIL